MKGRIKFVDAKSQKWGFITPDDGSSDVHFSVDDFVSQRPGPNDDDEPVEFEVEEDETGRHARRAKLLAPKKPAPSQTTSSAPGAALKAWAFVPFIPFTSRSGKQYSSVLEFLAELALDERWFFGSKPDSQNPFPILGNYLRFTFYRLQQQGRIAETTTGGRAWACFNTGLVDSLYDPIFALFDENNRPEPQWRFYDFCVPGKGPSGKQLTAAFDPLPEAASYFSSNFDMLLDTDKDIHVDYDHVIVDGIRRDRFPSAFLARHVPRGFDWQDYTLLDRSGRRAFLERLSEAVGDDVQCMRSIKNRLEDAKVLAEKRTRWNFKTAIPQYYPRENNMSLLLPLALVDDQVVDIALVVTRNPSGSYQGRTVIPLGWAYQNARLVCRPDSDWLTPESLHTEGTTEIDEDSDDGPE